MLTSFDEIDSVRRAIEHHPHFEKVDKISDTYFDIVDRVTQPELTENDIESIFRKRQFLADEHEFTIELLKRNQWLSDMAGHEGSVLEAYLGVLAQIDSLLVTV